jgi:hypothetical protein
MPRIHLDTGVWSGGRFPVVNVETRTVVQMTWGDGSVGTRD